MSTISSMGSMPRICSCGAYPVVEFLPHIVQWRVECPQCGKVGSASVQIDEAVQAWNDPRLLPLTNIKVTHRQSAGTTNGRPSR